MAAKCSAEDESSATGNGKNELRERKEQKIKITRDEWTSTRNLMGKRRPCPTGDYDDDRVQAGAFRVFLICFIILILLSSAN